MGFVGADPGEFDIFMEARVKFPTPRQLLNVKTCRYLTNGTQGSKTVLSDLPGQVDFPARQVHLSFHSHLLNGQWPRQGVSQLTQKSKLRLNKGRKKFESYDTTSGQHSPVRPSHSVNERLEFLPYSWWWTVMKVTKRSFLQKCAQNQDS